jgi:hypothetical protein
MPGWRPVHQRKQLTRWQPRQRAEPTEPIRETSLTSRRSARAPERPDGFSLTAPLVSVWVDKIMLSA